MKPSHTINVSDTHAANMQLSTFEGILSTSAQDQLSENKQV